MKLSTKLALWDWSLAAFITLILSLALYTFYDIADCQSRGGKYVLRVGCVSKEFFK